MALNKGFSLDFNGFLDLAEEIDTKWSGSESFLIPVVTEALDETRKYVNSEIARAIEGSKYNFDEGQGYSRGDIKRSLEKVKQMPIEVNGTEVTAYAGIDTADQAEEILYLIYGAPHTPKDNKLYNAIKVKGKVKKEVARIQREIFTLALDGKLAHK